MPDTGYRDFEKVKLSLSLPRQSASEQRRRTRIVSGPGASLDVTPERIVVVQAGDYYFVENLSPGEGGQVHDENFWEIQLSRVDGVRS